MPENRLFFALYPTAAERNHLYALTPADQCKGVRVSPEHLHITLVFLGECNAAEEARARAAADSVSTGPVELTLDRLVVWSGARVQVLLPPGTPAALRRLYASLRDALVANGFAPESRPWVPHVTVARKTPPHPSLPLAPVHLRFNEFYMFRSQRVEGRLIYSPLASWALKNT